MLLLLSHTHTHTGRGSQYETEVAPERDMYFSGDRDTSYRGDIVRFEDSDFSGDSVMDGDTSLLGDRHRWRAAD